MPEEFDDPFADEAKAGDAKAEVKAEATAEAKAEPVVAQAEPAATPVEPGVAGPGDASAGAPVEAAPASAMADTKAETKPEGEKAATAKKVKPTGEAQPVPKDKSPTPAAPEPHVPSDSPAPTPAAPPTPAPVATPTPTPAPAAPAQPEQNRFAGTFRYAGGEAQRQQLTDAIETTVAQLNALIRGIGRKRLTAANPIREQISFVVEGTKVTATFAAGRTISGTLGGPAVAWTADDGSPLTVAFSIVKGRLVMEFKADDGGRRSVFTLDDSGDKLTMSVTITSSRLDNPLKYALSYRRK
ncbi:hypothetical protein [Nannocystis pusilla]|uniref:hypothetical protein n=1 Tax=Nannocystis pusilla TaxID=889268 RepID=UPI003B7BCAAF